jgi:hypothetical protein
MHDNPTWTDEPVAAFRCSASRFVASGAKALQEVWGGVQCNETI